jgi:hypothetical protein
MATPGGRGRLGRRPRRRVHGPTWRADSRPLAERDSRHARVQDERPARAISISGRQAHDPIKPRRSGPYRHPPTHRQLEATMRSSSVSRLWPLVTARPPTICSSHTSDCCPRRRLPGSLLAEARGGMPPSSLEFEASGCLCASPPTAPHHLDCILSVIASECIVLQPPVCAKQYSANRWPGPWLIDEVALPERIALAFHERS